MARGLSRVAMTQRSKDVIKNSLGRIRGGKKKFEPSTQKISLILARLHVDSLKGYHEREKFRRSSRPNFLSLHLQVVELSGIILPFPVGTWDGMPVVRPENSGKLARPPGRPTS